MGSVESRLSNPTVYFRPDPWGGARYNCGFQALGLLYDTRTSETRYSAWADGQMRILLGANDANNTFVIGYPSIGSGTPSLSGSHGQNLRVHHRAATGHTAAQNGGSPPSDSVSPANLLVGALVAGPASESGSFNNSYNSYENNEVACDYNANTPTPTLYLRRRVMLTETCLINPSPYWTFRGISGNSPMSHGTQTAASLFPRGQP